MAPDFSRCLLAMTALVVIASGSAQAQLEWMTFPSEDGVFEAAFPTMPKTFAERHVKNGVRSVSRLLGGGNERFFCYAGYTDYSMENGEAAQPKLQSLRDEFINGSFATLLDDRRVAISRAPLDGLIGTRFTAIGDERRYTSVMALDGARLYQVIASSVRFGFNPDDVERCLTGFRLRTP